MKQSSRLQSLLPILDMKIEIGERNNTRKYKLEDTRNKIITCVNYLKDELVITSEMIKEINSILKSSQEAKKEFIQNEIKTALDCVFDEGYNVLLDIRPFRDTYKAELKLYTEENGNVTYFNINTQNGGLCRQVIALSAGFAMAKLTNCHVFMMDEALNGGDSLKLRKMQPIIKSYLDYHPDNTIILNEHNEALYQDLSCKIFCIHKEGTGFKGFIVQDSEEEQKGQNLYELEL